MKGCVYILANSYIFPNLVKIGYTDNIKRRLKDLNNTSLPGAYRCYALYEVNHRLADKEIFDLIDSLNPRIRFSQDKEFYFLSPEEAYKILESIARISDTLDRLHLTQPDGSFEVKDKKKASTQKTDAMEKEEEPKEASFEVCGVKYSLVSYAGMFVWCAEEAMNKVGVTEFITRVQTSPHFCTKKRKTFSYDEEDMRGFTRKKVRDIYVLTNYSRKDLLRKCNALSEMFDLGVKPHMAKATCFLLPPASRAVAL